MCGLRYRQEQVNRLTRAVQSTARGTNSALDEDAEIADLNAQVAELEKSVSQLRKAQSSRDTRAKVKTRDSVLETMALRAERGRLQELLEVRGFACAVLMLLLRRYAFHVSWAVLPPQAKETLIAENRARLNSAVEFGDVPADKRAPSVTGVVASPRDVGEMASPSTRVGSNRGAPSSAAGSPSDRPASGEASPGIMADRAAALIQESYRQKRLSSHGQQPAAGSSLALDSPAPPAPKNSAVPLPEQRSADQVETSPQHSAPAPTPADIPAVPAVGPSALPAANNPEPGAPPPPAAPAPSAGRRAKKKPWEAGFGGGPAVTDPAPAPAAPGRPHATGPMATTGAGPPALLASGVAASESTGTPAAARPPVTQPSSKPTWLTGPTGPAATPSLALAGPTPMLPQTGAASGLTAATVEGAGGAPPARAGRRRLLDDVMPSAGPHPPGLAQVGLGTGSGNEPASGAHGSGALVGQQGLGGSLVDGTARPPAGRGLSRPMSPSRTSSGFTAPSTSISTTPSPAPSGLAAASMSAAVPGLGTSVTQDASRTGVGGAWGRRRGSGNEGTPHTATQSPGDAIIPSLLDASEARKVVDPFATVPDAMHAVQARAGFGQQPAPRPGMGSGTHGDPVQGLGFPAGSVGGPTAPTSTVGHESSTLPAFLQPSAPPGPGVRGPRAPEPGAYGLDRGMKAPGGPAAPFHAAFDPASDVQDVSDEETL